MATAKKDDRVPAGSRKSLSQMSESHKAHILFWEPHMENLKAEFVWIAVSRFPERGGQGPHYVAVKRGEKDYAILDYDTANPKPITKRNVVDEGFTSSTAMLESFKKWRQKARDERAAASPKPKSSAVRKTSGPKAPKAGKAPAKPAAKAAAGKSTGVKRTTTKAVGRRRVPAGR